MSCHVFLFQLLDTTADKDTLSEMYHDALAEMCNDPSIYMAMPWLELATRKGDVHQSNQCHNVGNPPCELDTDSNCVDCTWG